MNNRMDNIEEREQDSDTRMDIMARKIDKFEHKDGKQHSNHWRKKNRPQKIREMFE